MHASCASCGSAWPLTVPKRSSETIETAQHVRWQRHDNTPISHIPGLGQDSPEPHKHTIAPPSYIWFSPPVQATGRQNINGKRNSTASRQPPTASVSTN